MSQVKEIVYPMSVPGYRKHWGIAEAWREIVQNSLDETGKYATELTARGWVIRDKGQGLRARHLILGVTQKPEDEETRGKFGEGLKIAAVVLERLGHHMETRSHDLLIRSGQTDWEFPDGTKETVLKLSFEPLAPPYDGTEVLVEGYSGENFSDKFIYEDDQRIIKSSGKSHLLKLSGKLFVKGIYVGELEKAMFGYDLWDVQLEESRHIADEQSVQQEIASLWSHISDKALILQYLRAMNEGNSYESKCGLPRYVWEQDAWKQAWESEFGKQAVVATSAEFTAQAAWEHAKPIHIFGDASLFARALDLQTDAKFLQDRRHEVRDIVKIKDLSAEKRRLWSAIIRTARDGGYEGPVLLRRFGDDTSGLAANGKIYIDIDTLGNPEDAFGTIVHEVTHNREGSSDNTAEMVLTQDRVIGRILAKRWKKRFENSKPSVEN